MFHSVDTTIFPPAEQLPADVAKLVAQRDELAEQLDDFETQWYDILASNWVAIAEAKDTRAAIEAAQSGKDAFKGKSAVTEASEQRPRVMGVHSVYVQKLSTAEHAARRAFRPIAGTIEPGALAKLRESASEAENAYLAYLAARERFGAAASVVRFSRAWQSGDRPDYNADPQRPEMASGNEPFASEPIAEIREIARSYEVPFTPEEFVTVVTPSGNEMELTRSRAEALVSPNAPGVYIREDQAK